MNRRQLNRLLLIIMGLWGFALLVFAGWSIADKLLVSLPVSPPPISEAINTPTSTHTAIPPTITTEPALPTSTATTLPPKSETAALISTITLPPTFTQPPANTPTPPPTSTPLPTAAPTLTLTPTFGPSPTHTASPTITPLYIATMSRLYLDLVGQWRGMVTIKINKQARPSQQLDLEFYRRCQTGEPCGRYRWEAGCFGDLVLMKWLPKKLLFRNVEYSSNKTCPAWVEYTVEPKRGDTLYLTINYKDTDGRPVAKSVTLKRR